MAARVECLGISNHSEVFQECKPCSAQWIIIGSNLGIPHHTLEVVMKNNPLDCEKCMFDMLAKWLKKVDEKSTPNWRSLCQALYSVDRATADQIAKKHHVTGYKQQKERILRCDIDKAVSTAKSLKDEFRTVLKVAYFVLSSADIGLFKLSINWFFSSERQTTPEIQQLLKELNSMPTSLDIIYSLINHNFIGYLNYKLLKEFQMMLGNEELQDKIQQYEKRHEEFMYSIDFNTIMEVFKRHRNLAPVSHIGLPEFEIHLEAPWNDKDVYNWTEFFELRFSWPPYLFVTGVSRMCIIISYAVLPIFVVSVVRDLNNPKVLEELKENGVRVQFSKELLEINDRISKPTLTRPDTEMANLPLESSNFSNKEANERELTE